MPAMRSSLAISASWRTAAITSAEVLVRCPRRRLYDALLQPCIGRGGGPNALEIGCERGERSRIGGGRDRGGVMGGDLGFAPRGRAPCSIAPPVRRSPIGWPGRQRRIAGRPDRLHSAPLRDHAGAPHALGPVAALPPSRQQRPPQ